MLIGKFCQVASGVKFIMGPVNHRMSSVTTGKFPLIPSTAEIPCGSSVIALTDELRDLLLFLRWWDLDQEKLTEILPLLCDSDLPKVKWFLREQLTDAPVSSEKKAQDKSFEDFPVPFMRKSFMRP